MRLAEENRDWGYTRILGALRTINRSAIVCCQAGTAISGLVASSRSYGREVKLGGLEAGAYDLLASEVPNGGGGTWES